MDGYYQAQIDMPYYQGSARQRGHGLGALALAGIRTALPIFRKFIFPTVKRVGKDFLKSAMPEVLDVVSGKKKPRQALKRAASNTVKKQLGGGAVKKRRRSKRISKKKPASGPKRSRVSRKKRSVKRSRADILQFVKS